MADIVVTAGRSTVEASLADRVVVRLAENASTGYQWEISEADPLLAVDSNELELPDPLLPGAAATRVVRFRPTGRGRARISMQLRRRWEAHPVDSFSAEVIVT